MKPVITSTWRVSHSKDELQNIFTKNGISIPIHDYTPILPSEGRGIEIEHWIMENSPESFIILDDNVRDIVSIGLPNVVKCRGWIGFSEEEYSICRKILKSNV